jgi:CHAT domain-containing protein/tetratricopeptide (TPR) repeat protein
MKPLMAWALAWALVSPAGAETPADDNPMATELLAQTDAAARESWLAAHRTQVTGELGRELAARGLALQKAGSYEPALVAFALAVQVGELAGDPKSRILGLHGQGEVERIRGRAQEAMPFLERGLQEAVAASDPADAARLSGTIGLSRLQLGEYSAALAIFEQQLATLESLGDAKGSGQAQSNIGIALGTLGRYAEAAEAFQRSLEIMEAAGYAPGVARAYNNLGLAHEYLGNYGAALEELGRSLQMKEAAGNRPELPTTLKNIGQIYSRQGAHQRALDHFGRSYDIAAEIGQKLAMAEALQDEGSTLLDLDRSQEGVAALERSLALAEEIKNPEAIMSAAAALADACRRLGDRGRALSLLQHSLEVGGRTEEIPPVVPTLRQIATLQLEGGHAAEALDLAEGAAERARQYELREELWPALLIAGRAQEALGHAEAAERTLREAVDVIEDLRAHAVGPEADRAAFLISRAAPYQELIGLLADSGRSWEALTVAERDKGRVLLEVLAGGRTAIDSALSEAERREERDLEARLMAANSELRALRLAPKPDADRATRLDARRAESRRALEDFRTRQYAAHPELRVLRGESLPLGREDVRSLVADGHTVLLEYALTEKHAYVFALSGGPSGEPSLALRRLDVESGEISRLARDLRERCGARDLDFAAPAARLYEALVSPVRDALRGARRVIVVPDGALWDLPFQALRSPTGRFLVEDVAVSYVPSLSVLSDMQRHPRARARAEGALLAMGNPELGEVSKRRAGPALLASAIEPLPEGEAQVKEIARLYDAGATAVRVGAGARESWFKAEAPRYRILHLATHGVLDGASPLYSELVLANPVAGESDDGLLEAREVLDLDLGADLAVLSACETGRGRIGAGEGLIGMTWAFFVAGCPTTVASQWKVEAAATNRLMLAFHRELQGGHAPAEALRLAALAQLRRADQRHPFYWAGFVAMGDAYTPIALAPGRGFR